jgi:hypothetical protein
MVEDRQSLLSVLSGIQSIAAVSLVAVIVWCYFKYGRSTRMHSAAGDAEGWMRFVKRTSVRTGLVVLILSLAGSEATVLGLLLRLGLPLTLRHCCLVASWALSRRCFSRPFSSGPRDGGC